MGSLSKEQKEKLKERQPELYELAVKFWKTDYGMECIRKSRHGTI